MSIYRFAAKFEATNDSEAKPVKGEEEKEEKAITIENDHQPLGMILVICKR